MSSFGVDWAERATPRAAIRNDMAAKVLVAPEYPALECGFAKGGCAMARQEILDRIQK